MVPFDAITMVMGDTDLVPYDAGTFGSQSTPQMGPRLRNMAATARQALIQMAAKQWGVDAALLTTADGKVTNPAGRQSLTYGQLTRGEQIVTTVSSTAPLTPAKDWKVAGTAIPKASGREFVTGKHKYPSDISLPGMMFGKVLRATGFNATLVSVDTTAAEKLPGVKLVRDGDFIGVVAPDAYTAEQAISFIRKPVAAEALAPMQQSSPPLPHPRSPRTPPPSNSPSPTPSSTSLTHRSNPAPPWPNGTPPASSLSGPEPSGHLASRTNS
jgi:isoquinoline 1-oxidoreductase